MQHEQYMVPFGVSLELQDRPVGNGGEKIQKAIERRQEGRVIRKLAREAEPYRSAKMHENGRGDDAVKNQELGSERGVQHGGQCSGA